MKSYEFLPHIADIRLKVNGDSSEELFTAALQGMGNIMQSGICPFKEESENLIKEKIEISSIDQTSLLIDFLSEVLTHSQVNKAIYCKVKFEQINNNFLSATIFGKQIEKFSEDIKAITYHETEIIKNSSGVFSTIIIFDI